MRIICLFLLIFFTRIMYLLWCISEFPHDLEDCIRQQEKSKKYPLQILQEHRNARLNPARIGDCLFICLLFLEHKKSNLSSKIIQLFFPSPRRNKSLLWRLKIAALRVCGFYKRYQNNFVTFLYYPLKYDKICNMHN
jgi:hypothetical protein